MHAWDDGIPEILLSCGAYSLQDDLNKKTRMQMNASMGKHLQFLTQMAMDSPAMKLLYRNMNKHYIQVEILINGEVRCPVLFGALKNAKKFIHLEYYIIGEGRLATELKEILLQKAAEGVEIRIIYDDVGSWSLSKEFIRELRKSDIQIYPFLPVRFHHLANKANYRNHRKIAVVDGEVGFVGGLNIADRFMDGVPGIGIWRDTPLKVPGEVVTSLLVIFLIDWYIVRQE